jgi:hypothetical protein
MDTHKLRPWEVRAGDRILGTQLIAAGPARYQGYIYADATDQQVYVLPIEGRDQGIPYGDQSWVTILRKG